MGNYRVPRKRSSVWENKNPILANGELGFDTTNRQLKMGDGVTPWNDLPYLSSSDSGGSSAPTMTPLDVRFNNLHATFHKYDSNGGSIVWDEGQAPSNTEGVVVVDPSFEYNLPSDGAAYTVTLVALLESYSNGTGIKVLLSPKHPSPVDIENSFIMSAVDAEPGRAAVSTTSRMTGFYMQVHSLNADAVAGRVSISIERICL